MKTSKSVTVYCSECIRKQYVLFMSLLIVILSFTYFFTDFQQEKENEANLSILVLNTKTTTLPRLFLNH